ncbi:MAG: methylmalonyl Co-A mutase-associated GTPase MeaB [Gammaproteobacteria bacterium]|nr:MAG: methylmalonyl Co-A mutase-associated GTPase MeaB [Gammaproteobacteria bacterium]
MARSSADKTPDPEKLAEAVFAGDRRALARAVTLVESSRKDHQILAAELMEYLSPFSGSSIRIGISGVPGVGKSTFIEAFGNHLLGLDHRVAVLSVDPTSSLSGGSILGDKTRMPGLAREQGAFIRPSPAGDTLGGVARHTRECIVVCEAGGFDVVIVETVGVGQSETAVADMTDMFVLLLAPDAGDELQGIKRGIVELADLVLVNKADGELEAHAQRTAAEYANALRLIRSRSPNWEVPVRTCSALTGTGVPDVWSLVEKYRTSMGDSGELAARRARQARSWLWDEVSAEIIDALKANAEVRKRLPEVEQLVIEGTLTPAAAARSLVETFAERERAPGPSGSPDRRRRARR